MQSKDVQKETKRNDRTDSNSRGWNIVDAVFSDRDGFVSFAELVHGYFTVGAATIDEKCDAAIRLYDVHGDVRLRIASHATFPQPHTHTLIQCACVGLLDPDEFVANLGRRWTSDPACLSAVPRLRTSLTRQRLVCGRFCQCRR